MVFGISWYLSSSYYTSHYAQQIETLKAHNTYLQDRLRGMTESIPPSQWRQLRDSIRTSLLASIKALPTRPKHIIIYTAAETEPRQYAAQFADAFRSIGITVIPRELSSTWAVPEIGLMVGLADLSKPSLQAEHFKRALSDAGIEVRYVAWTAVQGGEEIDGEKIDYDLYIGTKPW
jgi:hypothetical protein